MAGYSGTPLARKLGIKTGHRVALLSPPDGFEDRLAPLPANVRVLRRPRGMVDVVICFCLQASAMRRQLPRCVALMGAASGLWLAWPKKSGGLATDLHFGRVQAAGLELGLVDNKICALDPTWSGLRFVVRSEDRAAWPVA